MNFPKLADEDVGAPMFRTNTAILNPSALFFENKFTLMRGVLDYAGGSNYGDNNSNEACTIPSICRSGGSRDTTV
jgi:hypothetical protein